MPLPQGFKEVIVEGRIIEDPYPHNEDFCVLWCVEKGMESVGGMFLSIRPGGLNYAIQMYTGGIAGVAKAAVLPVSCSNAAVVVAAELQDQLIADSKFWHEQRS